MKDFQVRERGFYVNERLGLVREITCVDDNGNAHWRSYRLHDGNPTGDFLMCSVARIVQWADREATPVEVGRLKRSEVNVAESLKVLQLADMVLKAVTDEQLFAEVRRRGRNVT
jgi:hypothetical protein